MTKFRFVNLVLLADALTITAGLIGFLVARLGGHDSLVPVFGWVLGAGVAVFGTLLSVGLVIGAYHTLYWLVRTVLRRPPPDWTYD
jgi:cation transporter-like permease